jgi:hypothetical protein
MSRWRNFETLFKTSQFLWQKEEEGVAPFLQNVRLEISLWSGHLGSNFNLFTIILLTWKSRKSSRMVSLQLLHDVNFGSSRCRIKTIVESGACFIQGGTPLPS